MSGQKGLPSYLTPGMTVGPYLVEEQLGGGGFGFVYRVLRDGQTYALKIGQARLSELNPDERASTVERLEREVAALMSLHHPNIVRVHSFERWPDLEGGYPYLVMDLVEGTPLQEWRSRATPALNRIVAVFEKLADALAHMHELGIIHRDLKSQNILVQADGKPFIVDFGIARPRVAYDVTRAAGVGTLTHLTPEYVDFIDSVEARNGTPFDWRPTTDLYAFGYVLYEALTGQPPIPRFSAQTAKEESELMAAIKGSVPKRPTEFDPRIPPALDDLVMQLLEKDPLKRPQTAAEVMQRLREARETGEGASAAAWIQPLDLPRGEADGAGRPPSPQAGDKEEDLPPLEAAEGGSGAAAEPPPPARGAAAGEARLPAARQVPRGTTISLPTTEKAEPYDEGDEAPASKPGSKAPDDQEQADQILKRAAAEFEAATPKPRRWPIAIAAAAGSLVLALLLVIATREQSDRPPPKTLLSAVEAGALPASAGLTRPPAPSPRLLPEPSSSVAAPSDTGRPQPAPRAAPSGAGRPTAQSFDEELARQYGRLTILPDGRVVSPPPTRVEEPSGIVWSRPVGAEPDVLQRSQRVASASPAASAAGSRGVAFGAHLQARLLTNLDTRTIANGPVEALLHVPYLVRGQVVLPSRTMLYGTASESGGRFTIRFNRLRLPDDTVVAFEGIALARDDGKPGLAASGRIGQEPRRGEGLGSRVAKGTGNILLDTITGGTGQSIVRNAGQAALSHEEVQPVSSQWALLLDAGVVFDIFVERQF